MRTEKTFFYFNSLVLFVVLFGIVPNTFSISIVGFVFSVTWLAFRLKARAPLLPLFENVLDGKLLRHFAFFWAVCLGASYTYLAFARPISPGYDLAWFGQSIANIWYGNGLRVTLERPIDHLAQHWEPVLYTAAPFAKIFPASVAIVIWQWLGFFLGIFGAKKLADTFLRPRESHILLLLYVFAWPLANPLRFDAHPPVFGALLILPWLLFFIVKERKIAAWALTFLLMQCGEVFLPIGCAYLAYLCFGKMKAIPSLILSSIFYTLGFALIIFYQKHFSSLLSSGDAFPFAHRYNELGGDAKGLLLTLFTDPIKVASHVFTLGKISVFTKALFCFGPLPFFAFRDKKNLRLCLLLVAGMLPYFLKAGLTNRDNTPHTGTHHIVEVAPQLWCLAVIGLAQIQDRFRYLLIPFTFAVAFWNTMEWRRSPFFTLRYVFQPATVVAPEARSFLASIPHDKGVLFYDTEWLCPLASEREWLLCGVHASRTFEQMDLSFVVVPPRKLGELSQALGEIRMKTENGSRISDLAKAQTGWRKRFEGQQRDRAGNAYPFEIWQRL